MGPLGPEASQDSNSVSDDTSPQNCGVKDANASRTITKSRKILLVKPIFHEFRLDIRSPMSSVNLEIRI